MKRSLALIPIVCAFTATAAYADDDASDLRGLLDEPIVTTASKSAQADAVAPATTTMISSEDLQRYGMHTVGEALNFLSMGVVGTSVEGFDADEFGARGVLITGDTGSHFLVLINGHAVNNPGSGATELNTTRAASVWFNQSLGVPLEMIDHIEVTLGAGSVLYGTDAMLGIINIVTKRADAYRGVHLAADTQVMATGRGFAGAGFTFKLFGQPSEVTAGFEYFGRRGPDVAFNQEKLTTGTWGGLAHNRMDVPSGLVQLHTGNFEFNARATLKNSNLPTAGISAPSFDDPNNYQRERRLSFDVGYRVPIGSIGDVKAKVYIDSSDFQAQYDFFSPIAVQSMYATYWGKAELQGSFDWLKNGKFVTLVGAEMSYQEIDERVLSGRNDGTQLFTGSQTTDVVTNYGRHHWPLAAYGQQTWQPTKWLALNAGARVDYDSRFVPVASPRIAAAVKPWKGGSIKAIYSQAFSAPTLVESYESWHNTRLAAPNLVPETVRSVEGTFQQDFGAQHLRFGAFWNDWQNIVYFHTFSASEAAAGLGPLGVAQAQNSGSINNPGFNASFDGSVANGNLRYGLSFTGATAHVNGGSILGASANTFGNARISYDLPGYWPTLALIAQYIGPRRAALPYQSPVDPASLPIVSQQFILRPTISGRVPKVKGLSYRATANIAFASSEPYFAGPNSVQAPNVSQLVPVDKFRVTVGLAYDF